MRLVVAAIAGAIWGAFTYLISPDHAPWRYGFCLFGAGILGALVADVIRSQRKE
jgi:hypothetical protein